MSSNDAVLFRRRTRRSRLRLSEAVLAAALAAPLSMLCAQAPVMGPVLKERAVPDAPKNAFGSSLEGWVKLRYSVLADGTTADVRVVDAMPPQLPTGDAVRAVEHSVFAPANNGAEPIAWHNNQTIIVFDDETVALEPTPPFSQAYVAVVELYGEQKYEQAEAANERLLTTVTSRLNEIGLAQTQAALVNMAASDVHDAYAAIRRATELDVVTLPDEELREALRIRFAIELELGRVSEALDTFARYEALGAPTDAPADATLADDALAAQAAAIREALQSDAAIAIKGRVEREPWTHAPTRRTFTLVDVDGDVRQIRAECDRRKVTLEYVADIDWTLPESWGACVLFVDAKRDTTFTLYELK